MYNNINNVNDLFNNQNLNNINVHNDSLLNVDPDHNHDFLVLNCTYVDPNHLMINPLTAKTFSCFSLYFSSLSKQFQTLKTKITDHFRVIGLYEAEIDSNTEQLYNNYI